MAAPSSLMVWYRCQSDGGNEGPSELFEPTNPNAMVAHLKSYLCTYTSRAPWVQGKEEKDLPSSRELEVYLNLATFNGAKPPEFDETKALRSGFSLAYFQTTEDTPLLVKGPASVAGSSSSSSSSSASIGSSVSDAQLRQEKEEAEKELLRVVEEQQKAEGKLREAQEKLLNAKSKALALQRKLEEAKTQLQAAETRVTETSASKSKSSRLQEQAQKRAEAAKNEVKEKELAIQKLKSDLEKAEEEVTKASDAVGSAEMDLQRVQQQYGIATMRFRQAIEHYQIAAITDPSPPANTYPSLSECGGKPNLATIVQELRGNNQDTPAASSIVDYTQQKVSELIDPDSPKWPVEVERVRSESNSFNNSAEQFQQKVSVLRAVKEAMNKNPTPTINELREIIYRTSLDDLKDLAGRMSNLSLSSHGYSSTEGFATTTLLHYLNCFEAAGQPLSQGRLFTNERTPDVIAIAPALDFGLVHLEDTAYHRGEKMSVSSDKRKKEQASGLAAKETGTSKEKKKEKKGVLNDLLLTTHILKKGEYELFFLEARKPNSGDAKAGKDKLKLQKAMRDTWKRTWNDLFAHKSLEPKNLVIYGAQTHGLQLELFALDVVFADAYRFYSLGTFELPQSLKDFKALFDFLGMTLALRSLLEKQLELRKKAADTKETQSSPELLRVVASSSFGTPDRKDGSGAGGGLGGNNTRQGGGGESKKGGGGGDKKGGGGGDKKGGGGGGKKGGENRDSEEHRNIGPTDDDNYPVQQYVYPNIGGPTAVYFSKTRLGRDVAVKEFKVEGRKRWKRELRTLLAAHGAGVPYVVSLIDYYTPQSGFSRMDTLAVLVFPRLERAEIDGPTLGLNEKVRLFKQLILALKGLHALSIVHRDIKPSNLMLDPVSRDLILIDFDLSAFHCPLDDGTRDFSGTDGFVAPETESEGIFGPWSDIYGAGLVLLRALLGHLLTATVVNDLLGDWDRGGEEAEDAVHRIRLEAKRHLRQRLELDKEEEGLTVRQGCDLGIEMTRRDPTKRPSAAQVLCHPFLTTKSAGAASVDTQRLALGPKSARSKVESSLTGELSKKANFSVASVDRTQNQRVFNRNRKGNGRALFCTALPLPATAPVLEDEKENHVPQAVCIH